MKERKTKREDFLHNLYAIAGVQGLGSDTLEAIVNAYDKSERRFSEKDNEE